MTRDEHKEIINKVLAMVNPETQADAIDLLDKLSDDYDSTLTANETLTESNTTLTTANNNLRLANGKLLMRVGETTEKITKETETKTNDDPPALTFDALFNEKGELI